MTVVNPKSISGINSITMASGSDDLLTIHSNNTTERVRVNNSGDVIIGSGVTLSPDGDAFFTGVCTATSFVGSGANLTGISGVSVANQSDNRVITNTGTTDALNAEANLTFDGSDLTITNSGASNKGLKMTATGNYYPSIVFDANRSAENNAIVYIRGSWNGTEVGALSVEAGDDTTNKDDGKVTFYTAQGGTMTRKMAIEQDGDVHIDTGNVVIGTSGKGIDFSATSDSGGTKENELLDDYEEGTFTPTLEAASNPTVSYTQQSGRYTKIGNLVYITVDLRWSGRSGGSGNAKLGSLPFTSRSSQPYTGGIVFEKLALTSHADEATISVEVGSNQAYGTFLSTVHDSSSSTSGLVIGNFQNTSGYFMISFNYFTD